MSNHKIKEAKEERTRPITLHVEEIHQADLEHIFKKRITSIDIELSGPIAKELVEIILKTKIKGAMTIRLSGRLVLS